MGVRVCNFSSLRIWIGYYVIQYKCLIHIIDSIYLEAPLSCFHSIHSIHTSVINEVHSIHFKHI